MSPKRKQPETEQAETQSTSWMKLNENFLTGKENSMKIFSFSQSK